jgi:hypothetical protein
LQLGTSETSVDAPPARDPRDGGWHGPPGSRAVGRPKGFPNKTTREAHRLLREAVEPKVRELIELSNQIAADSPPCPVCRRGMPRSDGFRLNAILAILDRAGLGPQAKLELTQVRDDEWVNYTNAEEIETLHAIMLAAKARMAPEDEADAPSDAPIDVTPTAVDTAPRPAAEPQPSAPPPPRPPLPPGVKSAQETAEKLGLVLRP